MIMASLHISSDFILVSLNIPALNRLETLLKSLSQAQGTGLVDAIQEIDSWLETYRDGLDPRLTHFLARRSYEKAMQFLQTEVGK